MRIPTAEVPISAFWLPIKARKVSTTLGFSITFCSASPQDGDRLSRIPGSASSEDDRIRCLRVLCLTTEGSGEPDKFV